MNIEMSPTEEERKERRASEQRRIDRSKRTRLGHGDINANEEAGEEKFFPLFLSQSSLSVSMSESVFDLIVGKIKNVP